MPSVPQVEPPSQPWPPASPAPAPPPKKPDSKPGCLQALIGLFLLFGVGWCTIHLAHEPAQTPSASRASPPAQGQVDELPVAYSVPTDQWTTAHVAYQHLLLLCPRIGLVASDIVERAVDYYENFDSDWRKHAPHWKGWLEIRLRTAPHLKSPAWGDRAEAPGFADANAFFRFGIPSDRCAAIMTFKDNGPWLCNVPPGRISETYIVTTSGVPAAPWPPPKDCANVH
jgi:hypothetical protein